MSWSSSMPGWRSGPRRCWPSEPKHSDHLRRCGVVKWCLQVGDSGCVEWTWCLNGEWLILNPNITQVGKEHLGSLAFSNMVCSATDNAGNKLTIYEMRTRCSKELGQNGWIRRQSDVSEQLMGCPARKGDHKLEHHSSPVWRKKQRNRSHMGLPIGPCEPGRWSWGYAPFQSLGFDGFKTTAEVCQSWVWTIQYWPQGQKLFLFKVPTSKPVSFW